MVEVINSCPGLVPEQALQGAEDEATLQRDGNEILWRWGIRQPACSSFHPFFIGQGRLATLVTEGDLASRDTLQTSFLQELWAFLVPTQVVRVILVILVTLVILVSMSFLDPNSSWVFTNLII